MKQITFYPTGKNKLAFLSSQRERLLSMERWTMGLISQPRHVDLHAIGLLAVRDWTRGHPAQKENRVPTRRVCKDKGLRHRDVPPRVNRSCICTGGFGIFETLVIHYEAVGQAGVTARQPTMHARRRPCRSGHSNEDHPNRSRRQNCEISSSKPPRRGRQANFGRCAGSTRNKWLRMSI